MGHRDDGCKAANHCTRRVKDPIQSARKWPLPHIRNVTDFTSPYIFAILRKVRRDWTSGAVKESDRKSLTECPTCIVASRHCN